MRRKIKETTNQETPQLNEQTEDWFSSFQLAFSLFDVLSGLIVKYLRPVKKVCKINALSISHFVEIRTRAWISNALKQL